MVRIYTLTLAPSLDSATITPQIYPEGKLRCTAPVFEPGGGGINVARAIAHLGGSATAIFPAGGATGEHRCGTAQFSFGINLRGNCCAIERGRKCQRIDTYHHFLL